MVAKPGFEEVNLDLEWELVTLRADLARFESGTIHIGDNIWGLAPMVNLVETEDYKARLRARIDFLIALIAKHSIPEDSASIPL
jgi:hypothetical protein